MNITASTQVTWNGPICSTCGTRYLGGHKCSNEDILRRVGELLSLIQPTAAPRNGLDLTRDCPCRPENGGSGVCGCILGGPRIS